MSDTATLLKMSHAATCEAGRSRELTAEERAAWDEVAATGTPNSDPIANWRLEMQYDEVLDK